MCKLKIMFLGLLCFKAFANESCGACSVDGKIDLGKLFEKQQIMNEQIQQDKASPKLMVFVSLGMPEASIKTSAKQVEQVGGSLVIRGFYENSLQKTTAKVRSVLKDELAVDFQIDPESFDKYDIQIVPAVVVAAPQQNLVEKSHFDVVFGDIPLEKALEEITKNGSNDIKPVANQFLLQYKERKNG